MVNNTHRKASRELIGCLKKEGEQNKPSKSFLKTYLSKQPKDNQNLQNNYSGYS